MSDTPASMAPAGDAMPGTAPGRGIPARSADMTIAGLAAGLRPVRRLAPPWRRAALWLCAAGWLAGMLALFADFPALGHRLMAAPDMALSLAGAVLTAVCAALAAFQTSVPGRSARWAALPLPPLVLWLTASGAGCLRLRPIGWTDAEPPLHPMACLYFIVLVSAPLAALLVWQVMRACPLRPRLTASLAGLASAAAAASLLTADPPVRCDRRGSRRAFLGGCGSDFHLKPVIATRRE